MGGAQTFDGDETAEPEIGCKVDDSHPAFADDGLDFVVCIEFRVTVAAERLRGGASGWGRENRSRGLGSDWAACQIEHDGGFFLSGSGRSYGFGWIHGERGWGNGKSEKAIRAGKADGFIVGFGTRAVKSDTILG